MAEIRKAELRDLERVVALLEQFPDDPEIPNLDWQDARKIFPEIVKGERGLILLSEVEGELAGLVALSFTCALHFGGEYALIEDFIVDEAFRGQGIGKPLLLAAFEEARRHGCAEIQVNRPTEAGTPVYLSCGMHVAGNHLRAWLSDG